MLIRNAGGERGWGREGERELILNRNAHHIQG